ncbi:Hsp90 co-chaperone Cdc37 [Myotis davidii]|uniref:Hsp90 co-chaperone Cdc37 n=1 Tax=Myotis davidii TaxID=225400 RepID=L5LVT4_MYODS|nr:Hsp90 co-chaperone Cdc37 [Myotis davidii]
MEEYEEEGCKKWRGPGGLDPVEVDESLPGELQKCSDVKAVRMLQDAISKVRSTTHSCIHSGLWAPNSKPSEAKEGRGQARDPLPEAVSQMRRMKASISTCRLLCSVFQKMKIDAIALSPSGLPFPPPSSLGSRPPCPSPQHSSKSCSESRAFTFPSCPISIMPKAPGPGRAEVVRLIHRSGGGSSAEGLLQLLWALFPLSAVESSIW